MVSYSVYVREWQNKLTDLWWIKSFYGCNYKDERGAYKAANRYAKQLQEETGKNYLVIKDED